MRQQIFATDDFGKYRKKTRKEIFLEEMDQIIPWKALSRANGAKNRILAFKPLHDSRN